MTKRFFEVFPELKLEKNAHDLFADADVTRVSVNKKQDALRIYVESPHLIEKDAVFVTERAIRKQLFTAKKMDIRIQEHFKLSSQYSVRSLMELYLESILTEFKTVSNVEYTLLKDAELSYPDEGTLVLTLKDSVVSREKAPEIARVLTRILNERCGVAADVQCAFEVREDPGASTGSATGDGGSATGSGAVPELVEGHAGKDSSHSLGMTDGGLGITDPGVSTGGATGDGGSATEKRRKKSLPPKSPEVVYGRTFEGSPMPIAEVTEGIGEIIVQGRVIAFDERTLKNDRSILIFDLTDLTDTITCKLFVETADAEEIKKEIKIGAFLLLKGAVTIDKFDQELSISHVRGIRKWQDFRVSRKDTEDVKRVELHMHTKMSDMDGVSDVSDVIHRAYSWGMRGIAITDHGVAQSYPVANHTREDLYKKEKTRCKEEGLPAPDEQDFFKVIYGLDAYIVDDTKQIVDNDKGQTLDAPVVVFDLETTGFSPVKNKIIEIGAVKLVDGKVTDRFSEFVNPLTPIPFKITNLTSITDDMVKDAPVIEDVLPQFVEFCKDAVLVGHNAAFDVGFLHENCRRQGFAADYTSIDTMGLSRAFFPRQGNHRLETVAKTLKVDLGHHHRAVDDAECTARIFQKFLPMIFEALSFSEDTPKLKVRLSAINNIGADDLERIKRLRPFHATLLAKNTVGRVNLYTLISESHLTYFHRHPIIPKRLLMKYREGILIGSGGMNGELLDNLTDDRSEEELNRIINFYDFLEVMPPDAYTELVLNPDRESINFVEDIEALMKRVVQLGEQYRKTVVATSDAHYLDPEDEVYRRIIHFGRDYGDELNGAFYLRTTKEMLDAFGFLGGAKAQEVVVTNTNRIFDEIDAITPVRPDKCPPVIPNSDEILTKLCEDKAREIYGDPLPEVVKERMDRELHSIISNGFAVMYIIAQKLVAKSNEDGYLVGSRGSVGSSLVAFLSGITEVNALPPHYVCPSCHYSDFDSETVRTFAGNSGCDMPDCDCPKCGTKLYKDGFDIPFETFLGFKGDKEPDIDLNFSGEYQSRAHQYTEVIFGKGQTFRAGTIATLAEKTAFGIVKKYFAEDGTYKRKSEVNRIVKRCTGVRRGTGQHPGGIIVLPIGEDINSFTPVQHPANDMTTPIITTHFDYHSIDHNLLKLDILGHDDPTMIRFLQDITGVKPTDIPLDDPAVMQLFADTTPLHLTPADISGTKLGCLALPEFGTDFAMQMVMDAKPTSFSHLIRIAGLAHGTDVWSGNAEKLIKEGTATIDTAICTRDDIMIYLIQKGMDDSLSFKTMESVRKGKGLTPEMEEAMKAAGVPDWYIWSCKTIKYMFPKAHAAAYVMMAWRIAWFKVHMPEAFYAAWFSIRAKAFDYAMMCLGVTHLKQEMARLRAEESLGDVDANKLYTMRVIEEMYARGISFVPLDIYKAKAEAFTVTENGIMPSFTAIEKLGPNVAQSIEKEAAKGAFLSRDDFKTRTHCPVSVIENMAALGLFGDLPETNQISLFDLVGA